MTDGLGSKSSSQRRAKARRTAWILFGIVLGIYFLFIYLTATR